MDADDLVTRGDRGTIATLTLNRPEWRNALSLAMIEALDSAINDVAVDPSARVVVLAGSGPAFCAGHDLAELQASDATQAEVIFTRCSELMMNIGALPKPVIAKVDGVATAAGCQLVASCDLAVASSTSRFATPGVNIGLFCSTPAVPLVRAIAPKHAMAMLLTGELFSAQDAFRFGLINDVVDREELEAAVDRLADTLAEKPSAVIAAGKATLRRQMAMPVADAYALAGTAMLEGLGAPEAVEGICAFLDKRQPNWPHPPSRSSPEPDDSRSSVEDSHRGPGHQRRSDAESQPESGRAGADPART